MNELYIILIVNFYNCIVLSDGQFGNAHQVGAGIYKACFYWEIVLSPHNILFGDSTTGCVKLAKEICFRSEPRHQWEESIQISTHTSACHNKENWRSRTIHTCTMHMEGIGLLFI